MAATRMFCADSQETEFSELLANTSSYSFTSRGELVLQLKFDSGSVVFR
jgi:heat shock protein HslJ